MRPGVGLRASRQDKEHRPRNWEVKPRRDGVYETYQPIFDASTEGDLDEAVRKELEPLTDKWSAQSLSATELDGIMRADIKFAHTRNHLKSILARKKEELTEHTCSLCHDLLLAPCRLPSCRHVLCALCVEQSALYFRDPVSHIVPKLHFSENDPSIRLVLFHMST
ncbi:MAG: hypothetical protein SGPRY_011253 [Prymnesium sp.]